MTTKESIGLHTWSKDLDFDTEVERLKTLVASNTGKQKAYYAILLTQLAQTCRISEATEALMNWAKLKKETDRTQVKVRKRKDTYYRDVFIPKTILDNSKAVKRALNQLEYSDKLVHSIAEFTRYHLYNTHALRHASITHQGEMDIPAQVIAKGTGHKKVEHILIYTQRAAAAKVLKEMANHA